MRTWDRFAIAACTSLVRLHRSILIVATVAIGISAGRVAASPRETASWLLLGGAAVLVVLADLAREIEEASAALADNSGVERQAARKDVYRARRPRFFGFSALLAAGLFAAALALFAYNGNDSQRTKNPATPERGKGPAARQPRRAGSGGR